MKRKAMAAVGAMTLAFFGFGTSSAQAHEGGPTDDCVLFTTSYGATCFEWNGDDQWVYDGASNGLRVGVLIETDYGKTRICENAHGAGTWHECKFDHREERCVRFAMYQRDGANGEPRDVTNYSPWVSIRTGRAC